MKIEKRAFRDSRNRITQINLLLICETPEESRDLDWLGTLLIDDSGLIAKGEYEVRLSDGYAEHYVQLARVFDPPMED